MRIVISNGFDQFPLSEAAVELDKRGKLAGFLTGIALTGGVHRVLEALTSGPLAVSDRLLDRFYEIDPEKIHPIVSPELLHKTAVRLLRWNWTARLSQAIDEYSYTAYGRKAAHHLSAFQMPIDAYICRSGFGGKSIEVARSRGIPVFVYHSAAHPEVFTYLQNHHGMMPAPECANEVTSFWRNVLWDLKQADYAILEGHFVERTFLNRGWDKERIRVVYQGIDDKFVRYLDCIERSIDSTSRIDGPLRLVFAGRGSILKGMPYLLQAIAELSGHNLILDVFGVVDPLLERTYAPLLADSRIRLHGSVPRKDLARAMAKADVFVFPSLAEGSARVVFEAMAAGCYVITTSNVGSVVRSGANGEIVEPGNHHSLALAICRAVELGLEIRQIKERNRSLVRNHFRRGHFADQLEKSIKCLLS